MSFLFTKNKLTRALHVLQPSCCSFCHCRQVNPICHSCLKRLKADSHFHQCLICGKPNLSWVCKSCGTADWAFDQTVVLANETSRLVPTVHAFHQYGQITELAVILYAWKMIKLSRVAPVDLIIPFPENLNISQSRGFWSALELAKTWGKLIHSPYNQELITVMSNPLTQRMSPVIHPFQINTELISTFSITDFRIAIILPYMQSPHQLHEVAKILKKHGARSVINWVLIRNSSKENR
jgi:hypothetical protein